MRRLENRARLKRVEPQIETADGIAIPRTSREWPSERTRPSPERAALWRHMRVDNMTRLAEETRARPCGPSPTFAIGRGHL